MSISFSQYCTAILVIILLGFVRSYIYKFLFIRDVTIQDYSFFGYHAAGSQGGDRCREINDMRRRKRVGDCSPPYPNCWYAVGESDQVKQGQIKEVYALGHELIVWRGYSDKIFVSGAYCPHLGAHIGTGGTVVGADCIRCPFHHWSFNGSTDGKVHHIPYTQGKVPDSVKLTMWTSTEASGSIWIWYHADKEEPSYYPRDLEQIRNGEWVCKATASNTVTCHFQEIPENAADVSHLNALHGDKVSPAFARRKSEPLPCLRWEFIRHVFSATWKKKEDPTRKHEYYFDGTHHIELFKKWKLFPRELHGRNVGPSQSFLHFDTIFGKAVLVITVTPQEPHLQLVTQKIYASRWFPQIIANIAMRTQQDQFQRDIGVWNRKMYIANPPLVKEDMHIKEFRRYMLQFYSKSSLPCQYKLKLEKGLLDF